MPLAVHGDSHEPTLVDPALPGHLDGSAAEVKNESTLSAFQGTLLVGLLSMGGGPAAAAADEWTEDSFDEFRDGSFLDAGSNLYVSARGRIQIINRWDLNGDGFLDVIMPA
ncbi:MAG: hypothetical protein HY721_22845, partial [Planctomycetes bacterium]|nr:hypothetical protein [Planctomycetota bacterium]